MKKTVLIMVAALICVVANAQTDSVSGVRSEELGVRSEELGVKSEELGVRSEE